MPELILTHPTFDPKKRSKNASSITNNVQLNHSLNTNKAPVSGIERFVKIPSLVIHPDSLVLYSSLEYFDPTLSSRNFSHLLKSNKNHHRILSQQALRKLSKAIKYLIFLAHEKKVYSLKKKSHFNYKVGFITLTLSSQQIHTDKEITEKLLHQFLVEAKQKWKISRYVWKAEYQRNGNIHYHILVDRFIPYIELRNCWNRIQEKLGYISRAVYKKDDHPYNSTDIHSLYNVNDVTSYISKYMSKSAIRHKIVIKRSDCDMQRYDYDEIAFLTSQVISGSELDDNGVEYRYQLHPRGKRKKLHSVSTGAKYYLKSMFSRFRIWGCSVDLSAVSGAKGILEGEYYNEIEKLRHDKNCKVYDSDYYSVIYFKNGYLSSTLYPNLFAYFRNYLSLSFVNTSKQLIFDQFT